MSDLGHNLQQYILLSYSHKLRFATACPVLAERHAWQHPVACSQSNDSSRKGEPCCQKGDQGCADLAAQTDAMVTTKSVEVLASHHLAGARIHAWHVVVEARTPAAGTHFVSARGDGLWLRNSHMHKQS